MAKPGSKSKPKKPAVKVKQKVTNMPKKRGPVMPPMLPPQGANTPPMGGGQGGPMGGGAGSF